MAAAAKKALRKPLNRGQQLQLGASLLATIVFGGYFVVTVDWANVWGTLIQVDLYWLTIAAGFMLLHQIGRAIRIQTFISHDEGGVKLLVTCVLQSWLGMLLPSGLAQIAFVYMLKAIHTVSIVRALSGMVIMRLADLALFALLAFITISEAGKSLDGEINRIVIIVIGLLVVVGFGLVLFRSFIKTEVLNKLVPIDWLVRVFDDTSRELVDIIKILAHPKPALATVLMWTALFGSYAALGLSMGVELGLPAGILAFSLLMLINLLPIHGIAGIGTHHLAWYLVLIAVGIADEHAKVIATSSHVLLIALFTVWVVPTPLVLKYVSRCARVTEGNG